MNKKKAIKILNELRKEVAKEEIDNIKDGYARRFKESIKSICGEDSHFYDSAKRINFLHLDSDFITPDIKVKRSLTAEGIAEDLLNEIITYVNDFDIYKKTKKNYFEGLSNWKILTVLSGIASSGFLVGWGLGSVINLFSLFLYENQNPKNNKQNQIEHYKTTQSNKQPLKSEGKRDTINIGN